MASPALKGRSVHLFADDAFIVSYPKSGNTWMRFVVSNYIKGEGTIDFEEIESVVPDIYRFTDRELRVVDRPRLLKSHESLDTRYGKLVYVYRDPRAVAVSYFHHCKRKGWISETDRIESFVDRFVQGRCDTYGSWGDHVGGWLGARTGSGSFLPVRYEQLLEYPLETLRVVFEFLFDTVDEMRLTSALQLSSGQRVNAVAEDPAKPFVRSASPNDWEHELPQPCIRKIEQHFGPVMKRCGYELRSVD